MILGKIIPVIHQILTYHQVILTNFSQYCYTFWFFSCIHTCALYQLVFPLLCQKLRVFRTLKFRGTRATHAGVIKMATFGMDQFKSGMLPWGLTPNRPLFIAQSIGAWAAKVSSLAALIY